MVEYAMVLRGAVPTRPQPTRTSGRGGTAEMAALQPAERPEDYPEPAFFGPLPAQHFYLRHVRNIEFSNVEVASVAADARPSFWLGDVRGADLLNAIDRKSVV